MASSRAPPLLLAATIDVLRAHAPFGTMGAEDLAFFAGHLKLRYFADGAVIVSPALGVVNALHVVQRGLVRSEDTRGTALHVDALTLTPGESFPLGALIGQRPPALTYTAVGDTFCYLLDAPRFRELMDRSREFREFCTHRLAHLLGQSHALLAQDYAGRAAGELGLAAPLGATVRREAVTLPETASVGDMLALMKARRIGSVVLTDANGEPSGIFTQTDVLDRVALAQVSLERPARDVMTPEPCALPASSSAAEAAHLMARHGFRHLLVMEGGRLAGVVSERDLFAAQRRSLQGLRKEIRQSATPEALAFAAREIRALAVEMLAQGVGAEALTQLVTTLNDALVERAVALAAARHDLTGATSWCWIGLGSEGRREQTLATDQDNAIVYVPESGGESGFLRQRLLAFAGEVNVTLDACGFPLCKGDIMARNPRWCLTLEGWQECFDGWMRNPQPEALLNAAIFFDFRALAGDAALAERLREFLLVHVAKRPAFLRQMAANALETRPPLGVLGEIVVDAGTLDLKRHGLRPFVDVARVLALAHGVGETSTAGRLLQAAPRARLSGDEARSAVDAFHFIQMLRLRNQEFVERSGASLPNRIDPSRLHALDVRILKEALRQARKLQNRIALDYQL